MGDYLLTFEIDEQGEQAFVHGDPAGLEYFAKQLLEIAERAKAGDFPQKTGAATNCRLNSSLNNPGLQIMSKSMAGPQLKVANHIHENSQPFWLVAVLKDCH